MSVIIRRKSKSGDLVPGVSPVPIRILGMDTSTKTGWALLTIMGKEVVSTEYGTMHYPNLSGLKRVDAFFSGTKKLLTELDPHYLIIEGYGYGNTHTLVTLVEVGTAVRLAAYDNGHTPYIVTPTQLKKFVAGKGSAKKEMMMKEVYKRWGFEGSNDEVDAYALARFGAVATGALQAHTTHALDTVNKWGRNKNG